MKFAMRHFKAHFVGARTDVDVEIDVHRKLGLEIELTGFDNRKVAD